MRVALISDVHGNMRGLEAVLDDMRSRAVDHIVCLGDVAGTGPRPREALAQVRETGCPVVMGNVDAFLLDPRRQSDDDFGSRIEDIDRWCAEQLTEDDLSYLRSFVAVLEVEFPGATAMLCYHGTPGSYDGVIQATTGAEELDRLFEGVGAEIRAGGHTHFQLVRRHRDALVVNPGSTGLAYDRTHGAVRLAPFAEYAVVEADGAAVGVELRRVPFDLEAHVRDITGSGMPHAGWWAGTS